MKKTRYLFYLLLIGIRISVYSQEGVSSNACSIYLKPIINFDLLIGDKKNDVFNNVENWTPLSGKLLQYVPDDLQAYTANKNIILPNGYKTQVDFNFYFSQEKLVSYNLIFDIGSDHKLFWELIAFIKTKDKERRNEFIYSEEDNLFSYRDLFGNDKCKRTFSVGRSIQNGDIYQVSCKVN